MNVLIVEDDQNFASFLVDELNELEPTIHCTVARSKASAFGELEAAEYDLMLCDLSIPAQDGSLDEDALHGIYVYRHARQKYPGLPIYILTGHGEKNIDFVTEAVADAPKEDLWGNRSNVALTQFVRKAKVDDCINKILDYRQVLRLMDEEIELVGMEGILAPAERRLLRIFARRHNGAIVNISPLSGGLSSSKTLRVAVRDSGLAKTASAVAKLGSFEAVNDEISRYWKHIAPLLGPGSFTAYAGEVRAGTGRLAGIFYTLAEEYPRNLFEVLQQSEADAITVLDRIVEMERPWTTSTSSRRVRVEELRRRLIDQSTFSLHSDEIRRSLEIDAIERLQLTVKMCPQHGDLHGMNVLVTDDQRPVLIDYGDVDLWCASYDMVVLELSTLFHPAGCKIRGSWPSPAVAADWSNIDAYSKDCPFPTFIRRCREHALRRAAGPREVMANAYAFAVRQLKYPNTDKALVQAVAASAARALQAA
jgi:CheY-like chemotaxis protein